MGLHLKRKSIIITQDDLDREFYKGRKLGRQEGFESGYEEGFKQGYGRGYHHGILRGFSKGWKACKIRFNKELLKIFKQD